MRRNRQATGGRRQALVFAGWRRAAWRSVPDVRCLLMNADQKTRRRLRRPSSTALGERDGQRQRPRHEQHRRHRLWRHPFTATTDTTTLTLSWQPAAGILFLGWSGACSGSRSPVPLPRSAISRSAQALPWRSICTCRSSGGEKVSHKDSKGHKGAQRNRGCKG